MKTEGLRRPCQAPSRSPGALCLKSAETQPGCAGSRHSPCVRKLGCSWSVRVPPQITLQRDRVTEDFFPHRTFCLCLSVLSLSLCLCVSLSIRLSLSVHPSLSLCLCPSPSVSAPLSSCLFPPSLSLSVRLSLCLRLSLSVLNSTSSWTETRSLTLASKAASPGPAVPCSVPPSAPVRAASHTMVTEGKDQRRVAGDAGCRV